MKTNNSGMDHQKSRMEAKRLPLTLRDGEKWLVTSRDWQPKNGSGSRRRPKQQKHQSKGLQEGKLGNMEVERNYGDKSNGF
jgi:hypothetical protein